MRAKLILTALLFAVLSFAKAQTLNVRGTFKAGQVQELGLMLAPFGSASSEAITKMTPQDTIFTGSVLASDNGFYTLYGAYNGGQLIMPLYLPDTTTTACIELSFKDNCPVIEFDKDNAALSAFNLFSYVSGRAFWMAEKSVWTKDNIRPFLATYFNAADSIAQAYDCAPVVAEYLDLWAYTSVWKLYTSLPRMLNVKASELPFTMNDFSVDTQKLLNSPLAANFPETGYIILNTLPKEGLSERLTALYGTYTDKSVCAKVANIVVDGFIRKFDYSGDFEGSLAKLNEAIEKYGLNKEYVKEFTKRRASAKGTPFPSGITMVDAEGKTVDISSFKGYYLYIDLWASWCGPCCREVPHLQALEKELQNPNVKFVSISIDKDVKKWKTKMEALGMHGNQFLNQDNSLATALNVRGIPFFMIYDKEGKLYMSNAPRPSHPQLKNLLEELK